MEKKNILFHILIAILTYSFQCELKDGILSIKEDYNNIISENEKMKKDFNEI